MVSDLRYGWKKLRKLATDVSDNLTRLQVGFKRELIKEVKAFVVDAEMFRRDWTANGPMVPGLDPMEAVDRLRKFQQMFDVSRAHGAHACTAWRGGVGGYSTHTVGHSRLRKPAAAMHACARRGAVLAEQSALCECCQRGACCRIRWSQPTRPRAR